MSTKPGNIVRLTKDWWKEERKPSDADILVVQKKRRIPDRVYTVQELARRFNAGIDLYYTAIRNGELHALVVGRQYRITEEAVQDYLDLCAKKKGIA